MRLSTIAKTQKSALMKSHFLQFGILFAICVLTLQKGQAQLPDGSIAPDFTATDIYGVEHNLYSYLDSGYQVILGFHATWCGPCWSYHTSGVYEELNALYGPNGTDEIRILLLESDDSTTEADLYGTGANTQGDWVTGTSSPIIDNASIIFDEYQNTYYPTIYTVCPSRILTQSGQASVADHASIFQANSCQAATLANDAALGSYTGDGLVCGDSPATLSVELQNMGLENLTACTITAYDNGAEIASTDWTGDLDTYAFANVTVGEASFTATPNLTFEITSADGNDTNNSAVGEVTLAVESTTLVQIQILTDNWPGETGWEIADDNGTVIESVAVGSLTAADTEFTWDVGLPSVGCYTFTMFDSYGDGLFASQWGNYPDGSVTVYSMGGGESTPIYQYEGSSGIQFSEQTVGFHATMAATFEGCTDPGACNYWAQATVDDGNCDFSCFGCLDPLAWNFSEIATVDDGSCVYFVSSCDFLGVDAWLALETGLFAEEDTLSHEFGVLGDGTLVANLPQVMSEPTTGSQFAVMSWDNLTWSGLPSGFTFDALPTQMTAGSQVCLAYNGTPYEQGEFDLTVSGELILSVFGQPYPVGNFSATYPMNITPNVQGIAGCTYPNATNFLVYATVDNGSCTYEGCMDPEANNYQVFALTDDGSCVYEPCSVECPSDLDEDGAVGTGDLLALLGSFGTICN